MFHDIYVQTLKQSNHQRKSINLRIILQTSTTSELEVYSTDFTSCGVYIVVIEMPEMFALVLWSETQDFSVLSEAHIRKREENFEAKWGRSWYAVKIVQKSCKSKEDYVCMYNDILRSKTHFPYIKSLHFCHGFLSRARSIRCSSFNCPPNLP